MFSFFKRDPVKKLDRIYDKKIDDAMMARKEGKMREYNQFFREAELIRKEIESILASRSK